MLLLVAISYITLLISKIRQLVQNILSHECYNIISPELSFENKHYTPYLENNCHFISTKSFFAETSSARSREENSRNLAT